MVSEQDALRLLKDALLQIHQRASAHSDASLHVAAYDISRAVCKLGHPCPEEPQFSPCPVCKALPGQLCINVPGHILHDHYHPERIRQTSAPGGGA